MDYRKEERNMPLKDIEILSGTLYLNNEPIMKLDKCEFCEDQIYTDYIDETSRKVRFSEPTSGTIEMKIDRNFLLTLLYGRKVTNNWLKMHGGVMTRKKGK